MSLKTPEELIKESESVCDPASPGPYRVVAEKPTPTWLLNQLDEEQRAALPPKKATVVTADGESLFWGEGFSLADATFIATARTLLPQLAEMLKYELKQTARLQGECDTAALEVSDARGERDDARAELSTLKKAT